MKKILLVMLCAMIVFVFAACNNFTSVDPTRGDNIDANIGEEVKNQEDEKVGKYDNIEQNPVVTMTMENGGTVKFELYPKYAPQTVENFVQLVNSGFYNGLTFHRLIPSFVAQGGDPKGDGTGGSEKNIFGEFELNGFENELSHDVGVISMARAKDYNSASSQFFIVTSEEAKQSLDGQYAGFGKVIEGMETVYEIVNSEVIRKDYSAEFYSAYASAGGQIVIGTDLYEQYMKETLEIDRPINPPVIKEMTVETFGVDYGA